MVKPVPAHSPHGVFRGEKTSAFIAGDILLLRVKYFPHSQVLSDTNSEKILLVHLKIYLFFKCVEYSYAEPLIWNKVSEAKQPDRSSYIVI